MMAKLYFSVSFYQAGNSQIFFAEYKIPTPQPITSFYSVGTGMAEKRWTKIRLVSGASNLENVAKIRVYLLAYGIGAYPAHLVQMNTLNPEYSRCFWLGFGQQHCLGYALLHDASEAQLLTVRHGNFDLTTVSDTLLQERCRILLEPGKCMTPKPGYVTNMDPSKTNRMFGNIVPQAEYNALSTDDKKFFYEFTNNLGQNFVVSCPYSCK